MVDGSLIVRQMSYSLGSTGAPKLTNDHHIWILHNVYLWRSQQNTQQVEYVRFHQYSHLEEDETTLMEVKYIVNVNHDNNLICPDNSWFRTVRTNNYTLLFTTPVYLV